MIGAGRSALLRNLGVMFAPAIVGLAVGITTFGDRQEFLRLIRYGGTYRQEFK
jgi:putative effector of murein hydrolase LrgA (UPF0299 family)